jgi:hypothetical protein
MSLSIAPLITRGLEEASSGSRRFASCFVGRCGRASRLMQASTGRGRANRSPLAPGCQGGG